jgi:hypothetical protein
MMVVVVLLLLLLLLTLLARATFKLKHVVVFDKLHGR